MLGMCEYQLVLLDQREASGIHAVKREHGYGIQPAAALRVKVKETLPSKSPVARVGCGQAESFASADASTLIGVREEHGGSNAQDLPLQFNTGKIVAIDHIGVPVSHGRYGALDSQIVDAPGRRALWQPDWCPLGRLVDFMTQRNVMASLV